MPPCRKRQRENGTEREGEGGGGGGGEKGKEWEDMRGEHAFNDENSIERMPYSEGVCTFFTSLCTTRGIGKTRCKM